MDINKEREAFERLPLAKLAIESEYVYYNKETNSYWPDEDFCPSDAPETMNFAWEAWQTAKAQAVPEGFVLVSKEIPDSVVDRLRYSSYHWGDGTRDYFTPVYQMIIEAQEPTND